jgi:hypothetical protein
MACQWPRRRCYVGSRIGAVRTDGGYARTPHFADSQEGVLVSGSTLRVRDQIRIFDNFVLYASGYVQKISVSASFSFQTKTKLERRLNRRLSNVQAPTNVQKP